MCLTRIIAISVQDLSIISEVQNYIKEWSQNQKDFFFKIEGKKLAYARNYTPKSKKKFERSTINSSRALRLRRYL
jgi:hypothetical protein